MPFPKDAMAYPDHLFTIVNTVGPGKFVDIPIRNKGEQHRFHAEFSAFRKALQRDPMFEALYRKAMQIRTTTKCAGVLRFMHVNDTEIGKALTAALGDITAPAPATPTEKIAESDFVATDNDTVVLMSKYMKGS